MNRPGKLLPRRQRGVTLIESAVVAAVAATAASAVIPGMRALRTNQVLTHSAAEFETDVQHTRSLAAAANTTWRISFGQDGGSTCYVVHTGGADDCKCQVTGPAICAAHAQTLRTVSFPAGSAVALSANVRSMAFDPIKGTSTPAATVRFVARDGKAVHQVVNIMGRVRTCTPGKGVPGYKAC